MEFDVDLFHVVESDQELHQLGPCLAGSHPLESDRAAGRADPFAAELVGLQPPALVSAVRAVHVRKGAAIVRRRHRAREVILNSAFALSWRRGSAGKPPSVDTCVIRLTRI